MIILLASEPTTPLKPPASPCPILVPPGVEETVLAYQEFDMDTESTSFYFHFSLSGFPISLCSLLSRFMWCEPRWCQVFPALLLSQHRFSVIISVHTPDLEPIFCRGRPRPKELKFLGFIFPSPKSRYANLSSDGTKRTGGENELEVCDSLRQHSREGSRVSAMVSFKVAHNSCERFLKCQLILWTEVSCWMCEL